MMKLNRITNLGSFESPSFFESGGYTVIRIPGIVSLVNGDMLVYYECRRGGDWSPIDIGVQKSCDGGKTWSGTKIIVSGRGRNTMNNPYMIADGDKLHFFYCENYKRLFYCFSDDGGDSFSSPRDLTETIDGLTKNMFWSVIACGPGHGVMTEDNSIVIPLWFAQNKTDMFSHHPSVVTVLRMENGGNSFFLSKPVGENILCDPNESCIALMPGGELLLNIRNENDNRRRSLAKSYDGGKTWTSPKFCVDLPDPICCAGMCEYGNDILFSNCNSETERKYLTLKRINASWKISEKLLISEIGGYSDICYNKLYGKVFAVFENESNHLKIAEICIE